MNPNEVPIQYTFTLDTVNLIIAALAKMPFEQVEPHIQNIRSVALAALRDAEVKALTGKEVEQ